MKMLTKSLILSLLALTGLQAASDSCCKKCCSNKNKPAKSSCQPKQTLPPVPEPEPEQEEIIIPESNDSLDYDDNNYPDCENCTDADRSQEWLGTPNCFKPHTDETKFFKCVSGVPNLYNCPSGLVWNHDLLTCDWKD